MIVYFLTALILTFIITAVTVTNCFNRFTKILYQN